MIDSRLQTFPWPRLPAMPGQPLWCGDSFQVGDERHRILAFDASPSHWSPELTELHEREAGGTHPIDVASRRLAAGSLKRLMMEARPIVLDVGCSSGYVLREIHRVLPDAALIGSDYIVAPLLKLAKRMPDLPILQFDLRWCPLPDNCVDAVTALNVLEHIDEDERALSEIYRILKPEGLAYIEVPAGPELFDVYDEHLMHHRRYRLEDLVTIARRAGFEVAKTTHLGFFVYPAFWIVKKRNQRGGLRLGTEDAAARVTTHIRSTAGSALMTALMKIEMALARVLKFPFGIRCIAALRKPGTALR